MSTSTTLLDLAAPLWRKHLTSTHPIYKYGMAALCALALATSAQGAAPQVRTQAPGFYRMMLGDFEVTALFDGVLYLNLKELLTNTTHAQVDELLHRSFEGDKVPTSVNAYLINTGDKLILIDTGAGEMFGPGLSKLQSNLKLAGYQPEQVDMVHDHSHAPRPCWRPLPRGGNDVPERDRVCGQGRRRVLAQRGRDEQAAGRETEVLP